MLSPCKQLKLTNLMNHTNSNNNTQSNMKKYLQQGVVSQANSKKQNYGLNRNILKKKNKMSDSLVLTDRNNKNNNNKTHQILTFRNKSHNSKRMSQVKSDIIQNTSNNQKITQEIRKFQSGQNCQIILKHKNQQTQHFLKLHRISQVYQYLSKLYPEILYYQCIPSQITLDYLLKQGLLLGQFLNGQTLYLKAFYRCLQSIKKQIDLERFEIIKLIGCGGFSRVYLCRFWGDGNFYAMKVIDKQVIIKNKKKRIVMNQRNIMKKVKHPFVIEMKFAFESEKHLVFVMEYCVGGELFGLIKQNRKITQDVARFYIIEIFLGLAHLHHNHVVYRDIKPENILLAHDGHVKIADLGLAKPNMFQDELAYSFCGSPQYMSPEMILQVGHSYPVDFYCMGALLYELVTGLPPFYSREPDEIYESVLEQELSFPEDVQLSSSCRNLLKSLLCKQAKYRLGSLHGVKEVLAHPWFGKNNYQLYMQKQIQPPVLFNNINKFNLEPQQKNQPIVDQFKSNQFHSNANFKIIMKHFYYDYRQAKHKTNKNMRTKQNQQNQQNQPYNPKSMLNLHHINSKVNRKKSQKLFYKTITNK